MSAEAALLPELLDTDAEDELGGDEEAEAGAARYDLLTYPADWTLEVLHSKWTKGEIRAAEMQRRYVWQLPQASKLIESFLLGLPVPPLYLYQSPTAKPLEVIDGLQRLKTVCDFLDGYFGEETASGARRVFRLQLAKPSRWASCKFDELGGEDMDQLKNSVLRTFIMRQITPNDNTSIFHVFERLNTGGTLLLPQEVRNCVYAGPFNEDLKKANKYEPWRDTLGLRAPHKRLKDVELLLRFLALYERSANYSRPMKTFLSDYMGEHRERGLSKELRRVLTTTCDRVIEALGNRPFHLPRFNAAALDAVMVAFARHPASPLGDIKAKYTRLCRDRDFRKAIGPGTTDEQNVRDRMQRAEDILFS